jgi:hypothetical protein
MYVCIRRLEAHCFCIVCMKHLSDLIVQRVAALVLIRVLIRLVSTAVIADVVYVARVSVDVMH